MRSLTLRAALGGFCLRGPAQAAVLSYTYERPTLQRDASDASAGTPETLPGNDGSLVLSEVVFGGSLAGQSFSVACSGGLTPDFVLSGAFNRRALCDVVSLERFDISLDNDLQIADWDIFILDGPPDYSSTPSRDIYTTGDFVDYQSSAGGVWTLTSIEGDLAPIPLPASGWLTAAALIGLAGLRRRRGAAL